MQTVNKLVLFGGPLLFFLRYAALYFRAEIKIDLLFLRDFLLVVSNFLLLFQLRAKIQYWTSNHCQVDGI